MRACLCELCRRRLGRPQVFADLHAEGKVRHCIAREYQRRAARKQRILSANRNGLKRHARARGKVALLVKLGITRNTQLGDNPLDNAVAQHSCDVEQLAANAQRQANDDGSVELCRLVPHGFERSERAVEQRLLQEQVAAGVAGQAQLGKHNQLCALVCGLLCQRDDFRSIIGTVGHTQRGRSGCNFDKSVLHSSIPPGIQIWLVYAFLACCARLSIEPKGSDRMERTAKSSRIRQKAVLHAKMAHKTASMVLCQPVQPNRNAAPDSSSSPATLASVNAPR